MYYIFYFYLAPVNWELHLHASRVFFAKAKIKLAKTKIKSPEDKFHKIHTQASVFNDFNPISDLFSLLSIKSKSHSQSQKSSFSLLPISSLSSLNPSLSSLHTLHNPNPNCCRRRLITTPTASPHFPPWVEPFHANGSAS